MFYTPLVVETQLERLEILQPSTGATVGFLNKYSNGKGTNWRCISYWKMRISERSMVISDNDFCEATEDGSGNQAEHYCHIGTGAMVFWWFFSFRLGIGMHWVESNAFPLVYTTRNSSWHPNMKIIFIASFFQMRAVSLFLGCIFHTVLVRHDLWPFNQLL